MENPNTADQLVGNLTSNDSAIEASTAFFNELSEQPQAKFMLVNKSNDGYSCEIYKTKSDCDWHPPCHWSGSCN